MALSTQDLIALIQSKERPPSLEALVRLAQSFAINTKKPKAQKEDLYRARIILRLTEVIQREAEDGAMLKEGSRGPSVRHLQKLMGRPPTGLMSHQDIMQMRMVQDLFKMPASEVGSPELVLMLERYGNPTVTLGPWFSCKGCGRNMPKGKEVCFDCERGAQ